MSLVFLLVEKLHCPLNFLWREAGATSSVEHYTGVGRQRCVQAQPRAGECVFIYLPVRRRAAPAASSAWRTGGSGGMAPSRVRRARPLCSARCFRNKRIEGVSLNRYGAGHSDSIGEGIAIATSEKRMSFVGTHGAACTGKDH